MGPYETERDALREPMPREVRALHTAGRVRSGDPDRIARGTVLRHLTDACAAAGVELGAHDRRTLAWLAGWGPDTAQVVIGLVTRAYEAGHDRTVADMKANLSRHMRPDSDPCQDAGVSHPCDVAQELNAAGWKAER